MKKILLTITACMAMATGSFGQTILTQNFTSATVPGMPTGWTMTHAGTGGSGWESTTSPTYFLVTYIPTTGVHNAYAVVNEYTVHNNTPAVMTSPVFSLTSATSGNAYLSYDYYYFRASLSASPYTGEQAWVEYTSDGTTWNFLDSVTKMTAVGPWATKFVALPAPYTATYQIRFKYTDNGANLLGVGIDEINVFNRQANDLQLISVSPLAGDPAGDYIVTGSTATFGGVVRNIGNTTVTGFTPYYKVGSGSFTSGGAVTASIAPLSTYTFTCTPYTVATAGSQNVTIAATATAPGADANLSNDTMGTVINGVASFPHKKMLCEEGTGSGAGIAFVVSYSWILYGKMIPLT